MSKSLFDFNVVVILHELVYNLNNLPEKYLERVEYMVVRYQKWEKECKVVPRS